MSLIHLPDSYKILCSSNTTNADGTHPLLVATRDTEAVAGSLDVCDAAKIFL